MPCLGFGLVKNTNIFLCAIKMQAAYRFAVVIIEQNTKIAFGITVVYTTGFDYSTHNCLNDMIALKFFNSSDNFTILRFFLCFNLTNRGLSIFNPLWLYPAHCRLEAFIDLVI